MVDINHWKYKLTKRFYFVVSLLADESAWYFSEANVFDVLILAVLMSVSSSVVCWTLSTKEFRFCPEPEIIFQLKIKLI